MSSNFSKLKLCVAVFAPFILTACPGLHTADTYVWDVSKGSPLKDYFPERDKLGTEKPDFRTDAFKGDLDQNDTFGLAFTGGGTRAATMALGQLRALHELGWMKKVQYISAVSGGAWTVVPYSFLPGNNTNCSNNQDDPKVNFNFDDKVFLERYIRPEKLTLEDAKNEPPNGSMAKAITNSWLGIRTMGHLATNFTDKAYATAVGDTYLRPFNLSDKIGWFDNESRSFALRRESVENSNLPNWEFNFLRCGRPYPIIGATVITKGFRHKQENLHRLEITPDYMGVRVPYEIPGEQGKFGGYYMQPFAYDAHGRTLKEPLIDTSKSIKGLSTWTVKTGGRTGAFSLSDVVGVSGAAPQDFLSKIGFGALGFPEYHLSSSDTSLKTSKNDFYHGDGGHVENQGIIALIVRRVQNIVAFVNTASPINCREDDCAPVENPVEDNKVLSNYVRGFFQKMTEKDGTLAKYGKNHIIDNKDTKFAELVSALKEKKQNGQPLVHCDTYDIIDNEYIGMYKMDGYKPNICWVYLDRSKNWMNALPNDETRDYAKSKWRNLPHFKTFLPGLLKPAVVDLTHAEVNIGSNNSAWAVCESAKDIIAGLTSPLRGSLKKSCNPD
ncbi:MAG: hypothetical protein V7727_09825 [Sneathiella sp.]